MIGTLIARRAVSKGFDVFNTRDHRAAHEGWAEDSTLFYPGDIEGVSGTHRGKAAVDAWYQKLFEQFPSFQVTVRDIAVSKLFDFTGNNVIAVTWDLDQTNGDGFRMEISGVSVMTIRRGKVVSYEIFLADTGERLRRAWGVSG